MHFRLFFSNALSNSSTLTRHSKRVRELRLDRYPVVPLHKVRRHLCPVPPSLLATQKAPGPPGHLVSPVHCIVHRPPQPLAGRGVLLRQVLDQVLPGSRARAGEQGARGARRAEAADSWSWDGVGGGVRGGIGGGAEEGLEGAAEGGQLAGGRREAAF